MNLGSVNEQIRKQSIAHCIQGLYLSKQSGAEYFSAHAGFCIDPNPEQLGEQLDVNIPISRAENWNLFITSIKEVLVEAEKLNVSFLIENNVTAKFNLRNDEQEVLFCSRPEEMIKLIKEINSNKFGLLLDTAHLKVSSKTLHFDLESAVNTIKSFVKYIHHSDNNGEKDTNEWGTGANRKVEYDNSAWLEQKEQRDKELEEAARKEKEAYERTKLLRPDLLKD